MSVRIRYRPKLCPYCAWNNRDEECQVASYCKRVFIREGVSEHYKAIRSVRHLKFSEKGKNTCEKCNRFKPTTKKATEPAESAPYTLTLIDRRWEE